MSDQDQVTDSDSKGQEKFKEMYNSEVNYSKGLRERAQRAEQEVKDLKDAGTNANTGLQTDLKDLQTKYDEEVALHAKTKGSLETWDEYGNKRKEALLKEYVQDEDKRKEYAEWDLKIIEEFCETVDATKPTDTSTFQHLRKDGVSEGATTNPADMKPEDLRGSAWNEYVKTTIGVK